MILGFAGNRDVVPKLVKIMDVAAAQTQQHKQRNAYYAANAITRIMGEDVQDRPIEEMDLERMRERVHLLVSRDAPP